MKVTLLYRKIILFGNNIPYFVYQICHLKKKSISRKKNRISLFYIKILLYLCCGIIFIN